MGPGFVYLFILGRMTKRAQVPFRAWLPAAIAAPTPVSALVHSSTLVTAGVYILFRSFGYLRGGALNMLASAGILTTLLAGLRACTEVDMKKIVALRTLRQLGVIVTSLGAGLATMGFMHLLTHAFFKALLFISVGNLISTRRDYQDMRKGRSPHLVSPVSFSVIFLSSVRLAGLPFAAGFYRKEVILEIMTLGEINCTQFLLYFLGVGLTVAYSARFLFSGIFGLS